MIGLKTQLYNEYKELAQKCAKGVGGFSSVMNGVRGLGGYTGGNRRDMITLDKVLSELYYMTYLAVDGKKDKLNGEKLLSVPGLSDTMWVFVMSIRCVAISWANVRKKKLNTTPPYILADLERIGRSKNFILNITDRGLGSAGVEFQARGFSMTSNLVYSKASETYKFLLFLYRELLFRTFRNTLQDNELQYLAKAMESCAKKIVANFK